MPRERTIESLLNEAAIYGELPPLLAAKEAIARLGTTPQTLFDAQQLLLSLEAAACADEYTATIVDLTQKMNLLEDHPPLKTVIQIAAPGAINGELRAQWDTEDIDPEAQQGATIIRVATFLAQRPPVTPQALFDTLYLAAGEYTLKDFREPTNGGIGQIQIPTERGKVDAVAIRRLPTTRRQEIATVAEKFV